MCNGYNDEDDNVLNSSIHEPLVQFHTEDQDEPELDDLTDIKEEPLSDPPITDDGEIGHLENEDLNGQLLDDESKIHEPLVQVGIEEKSIEMTSLQRKYQKIGHTALLAPTSKILENQRVRIQSQLYESTDRPSVINCAKFGIILMPFFSV